MESVIALLVVGGIAGVIWWSAASETAHFVVRLHGGTPTATRGTVTESFLSILRELCTEFGVTSGEVRGVANGDRISLRFSRGLPPGFCQRARNWWAMSGWSARPHRRLRP